MLSVFYYSLQNYNPTKPWRNGFAGPGNFTQIFAHVPQFRDTLTFGAKWVVAEVGLQLLFGLALSRALVFSPWTVSGVLTSAIWVLLYNSQTGITRYTPMRGSGRAAPAGSRTPRPSSRRRSSPISRRGRPGQAVLAHHCPI